MTVLVFFAAVYDIKCITSLNNCTDRESIVHAISASYKLKGSKSAVKHSFNLTLLQTDQFHLRIPV